MTTFMPKPNAPYPSTPTTTQSFMPNFTPDFSIKGQSFDDLLQNRGIHFIHYRGIVCPNVNSVDDNSHDPLCPFCDGDGILYYNPKEIVGIFYGNAIERQFEYQGEWEMGHAMITFPTMYPDGLQAEFTMFDKVVIKDFTVRLWELKEYEPRKNNQQQLRYPATQVEAMFTVTESVITEFREGVNFTIAADGNIQWIPGMTPLYDPYNKKGQPYSVAYLANPQYIVQQPMRELRVTQEIGPDGIKIARRLPQQVLVKRDFFVNKPETLK